MRRVFLIFAILNHSSIQVTKFIMSKKLLRSRNLLKEELEEAKARLLSYVRRVERYVQVEKQLKTCEEILSRAVEQNLQLIESAE